MDGSHDGNRTTAERWGGILRSLGWQVVHADSWDERSYDVLVALHARKSHDSVVRFHRAHPERPLIVCGTGTDLYTDVAPADGDEVKESLRCATRVVVLQPLALERLPSDVRERTQVIHQSVARPARAFQKPRDVFQVAFPANIRPVKDPLTAARAAELLPRDSAVRIVQAGAMLDEGLSGELSHAARECPAFVMRGALSHAESLELIGSSHLVLNTSRHEGGANVLSEALAYGVPILCTKIPGSLGLLGDPYPGAFPVGNAEALAELLVRASTLPAFYAELALACKERAWLTDPRTEREGWRRLLDEVRTPSAGAPSPPA